MSASDVIRSATRDAYTDREGLGTGEAFDAATDAAYTATLRAAYWKLREHATGYRNANAYQRAQELAKSGDPRNERHAAMHRAFARGIEAAGEDIAAMLGIPEHEIEPVEP
ncbi:hypothetical protein [Micromonospora sp. NPDC005174]|uniref:hypothetical protein n=1 Tax=Micromonospora sp. NPDC005174 TaxID=3157018 RepID=UPI0033A64C59